MKSLYIRYQEKQTPPRRPDKQHPLKPFQQKPERANAPQILGKILKKRVINFDIFKLCFIVYFPRLDDGLHFLFIFFSASLDFFLNIHPLSFSLPCYFSFFSCFILSSLCACFLPFSFSTVKNFAHSHIHER